MIKGQAVGLRIQYMSSGAHRILSVGLDELLMLFSITEPCLYSNCLVRKTGPIGLALVGLQQAGRQAGWQTKYRWILKSLKTLHRLNHLNFYFININALLLIVLEVYFSLLFSNKNMYFRVGFQVRKIQLPFLFMLIPTI